MKTLFLVRHAKSSWDDPALADEDRPLNARGKRDAPKMAKRLSKRDVKVDLMLSSPANRAIRTAKVLAQELDYKLKSIVVDERLYPGAESGMLKFIHGLGNEISRVMLVGHHPALSELAHRLSSDITHMPTCAVAEFTFKAKSWRDVGGATLIAVRLDLPKKPSGSFAAHKQGDADAER
jgi:phosphohistidine phosphatase